MNRQGTRRLIYTSRLPGDFDPRPYVNADGQRFAGPELGARWKPRPFYEPTSDPFPIVLAEGARISLATMARFAPRPDDSYSWKPRAEFARAEGNPILSQYRQFENPDPREWLLALDGDSDGYYTGEIGAAIQDALGIPSNPGSVAHWQEYCDDMTQHAARVFERLAARAAVAA